MQRYRRSLQRDNRAHAHTCSISIVPLDDIIAIAVRYSLHAYIARICIGRLAYTLQRPLRLSVRASDTCSASAARITGTGACSIDTMILLHVHRAATVLRGSARIAIHSARTSPWRRAFAQISMQAAAER